jgi:hypothetical protein
VDIEHYAAYNPRNAAGRRAEYKAAAAASGRDAVFSDEVPEGVVLLGERPDLPVGEVVEHWCPMHGLEYVRHKSLEDDLRSFAPTARFVRDVYSGLYRPFGSGTFTL